MYSPETGRFTTRDTWQGDYTRPQSLNRWTYVEGNPIILTDPTGRKPVGQALVSIQNNVHNVTIQEISSEFGECNSEINGTLFGNIQYDLTGYLALSMTAHGNDLRINRIAGLISRSIQNNSIFDLVSDSKSIDNFLTAYLSFNELEGANKEWDIKVNIRKELGNGIVLCGLMSCDWFDYSTPGNIHFGYVAGRAKIDQNIAAILGGVLEQKDLVFNEYRWPDLSYCAQNRSILFCDNPQDQAAVDFGYELARNPRYRNGISEEDLIRELTPPWMSKFQRPVTGFIPPHYAVPEENLYDANYFNN